MLSYRILSVVSYLLAFSLVNLVGELFVRKRGGERNGKFLRYVRIVFFAVSFCIFIWLLCNKELFHWNFDIATGEPVDHYSTYGRCVIYSIIALVSHVVSYVIAKSRT